MTATRKQKYDVAINGQGLILAQNPEQPLIHTTQDAIFTQRYAQGDRDYNDFEKYWYWAQTDWSGGFKDSLTWTDDAKFFASTNLDVWSEPGAIKLATGLTSENDFAEDIWHGSYETISGVSYPYIGTKDNSGDSKPRLYRKSGGVWTNIISGYIPTTAEWVADAVSHKDKLWVITVGGSGATTYAVFKAAADGSGQTDYTGAIATAMGWTAVTGATAIDSDGNVLYVAVQQYGSNKIGLVKTADSGANWTKILEFTNITDGNIIASILLVGTKLFYLIEQYSGYSFYYYDLSLSANVLVQTYFSLFSSVIVGSSASRRLLHSFQGKVIVTIPRKEIWEFDSDTGTLTRLLKTDDFKNTSLAALAGEVSWAIAVTNEAQLKGGIIHDNRIWWGNLMYDGTSFYNTKKNSNETVNKFAIPVFSDGNSMYWASSEDWSILYVDSGYKGTADKNYLILSQFDKVSGIDKLAYSVTIIFKALASGQKISVEYLTTELTSAATWTVLGSVSFAIDGAITQKTLYFGDAVTFRKLWLRIKLEGNGTTTPTVQDYVMAYLPMPDNKLRWSFTVKCTDELQLKDQSKEIKSGLWLRNLLREAWITKSIVGFEDYDAAAQEYISSGALTIAATSIGVSGTTDNFPERGLLLIESEQIFYTGKTKTTFTGCTRGVRGSVATAHSAATAITMGYRVLVRNYQEKLILANNPLKAEYQVSLEIAEV